MKEKNKKLKQKITIKKLKENIDSNPALISSIIINKRELIDTNAALIEKIFLGKKIK